MQRQKEIQFAANVMLLDVGFLNDTASKLKAVLEDRLERSLPEMDLVKWLSYVALDSGLRGGDNEIQVFLLHDVGETTLEGCLPDSLSELDGKACRDALGEFVFYGVNPAQIVDKEHLFADLMALAIDSEDVKRLMLIPHHTNYGGGVEAALCQLAEEKEGNPFGKAIYFALQPPMEALPCRIDSIIYSLAQTFEINPDEL